MLRGLALTIAIAVSGCSFVLVKAPMPPPMAPGDCTDHYVVPAIDAVIATAALVGVIYFAQSDESMRELGMLVEGSLALGFGASAFRGKNKVRSCRRARASYVPPAYPPPPPPPPYAPPPGASSRL
jgi:hypothetical protein